jgi:Transposase IS116/IS110/IS902 family
MKEHIMTPDMEQPKKKFPDRKKKPKRPRTYLTDVQAVKALHRDLVTAAATMSVEEARFLVDLYYSWQDDRKASDNQVRQMPNEPHGVLAWLADQSSDLEKQIVRALESYTDARKPVGPWLKAHYGIGPVISAGLLAHIDITKCPTVGHIWRFAGLDPTVRWGKGEKRPWNAELKTLTWKIGQSFMKFSNAPECAYGAAYKSRKEYETIRNDRGDNAALAARILTEKKFRDDTDAKKHLLAGRLPPAQIDGRARRWAVKLFLSHLHLAWYFAEHGELPPKPYVIEYLGHAHFVKPHHLELIPGLRQALA